MNKAVPAQLAKAPITRPRFAALAAPRRTANFERSVGRCKTACRPSGKPARGTRSRGRQTPAAMPRSLRPFARRRRRFDAPSSGDRPLPAAPALTRPAHRRRAVGQLDRRRGFSDGRPAGSNAPSYRVPGSRARTCSLSPGGGSPDSVRRRSARSPHRRKTIKTRSNKPGARERGSKRTAMSSHFDSVLCALPSSARAVRAIRGRFASAHEPGAGEHRCDRATAHTVWSGTVRRRTRSREDQIGHHDLREDAGRRARAFSGQRGFRQRSDARRRFAPLRCGDLCGRRAERPRARNSR